MSCHNYTELLQPFVGKNITFYRERLDRYPQSGTFHSCSFSLDGRNLHLTMTSGCTCKCTIYKSHVSLNMTTLKHDFIIQVSLSDYPSMLDATTFDGKTLLQISADVAHRASQTASVQRLFIDAVHCAELEDSVALVSADGTELTANKAILSARSPVFAAMFATDMKEKQSNKVFLKDYSTEALETFLALIYVRPLPDLKDHLQAVIQLLDMYDVGSLKKVADVELNKLVSVENAGELFFQAAKHRQPEILEMAFKVICANKAMVLQSDSWKMLKTNGFCVDEDGVDALFK